MRWRGLRLAGVALAVAFLLDSSAHARDRVPLPPLRPSIPADSPLIPLPRPRPAIPLPDIAAEPAGPSECQLRMTADIAVIEVLPPVTGASGCGIDDPVRLSAVMTKDKGRIAITPAATLRCTMAEAVANWIREEVAPIAATLGARLAASPISIPTIAAAATAWPVR